MEPIELAKAFEKFENKKPRTIYGVHIIHYTINTYCTFGFEERMHFVDGMHFEACWLVCWRQTPHDNVGFR